MASFTRFYLATPESGMSSILKPSINHLEFFNGFGLFGVVRQAVKVQSKNLMTSRGSPPSTTSKWTSKAQN